MVEVASAALGRVAPGPRDDGERGLGAARGAVAPSSGLGLAPRALATAEEWRTGGRPTTRRWDRATRSVVVRHVHDAMPAACLVSRHRASGWSPEPLYAAHTAATATGVPNARAAEAPAAGAGPSYPDDAPAANSLSAAHEAAEREKRSKGSREADEEAAFMKKQVRGHPNASRCLQLCGSVALWLTRSLARTDQAHQRADIRSARC